MRTEGSDFTPQQPSRLESAPAPGRRSGRWGVAIFLAILGALLLTGVLAFRAVLGGTTVAVTNVGDRPVDGIALLAVSESSEAVRAEWPIGTLRPGETREIEDVFSSDTNLAVRLRTAGGEVVEDRMTIYLGSPRRSFVRVDLTGSGVVRVQHRFGSGSTSVIERDGIHRGLERGP